MKADLEAMTVPQLKELAKTAGIQRHAGMTKAELISALEKPIESANADQAESEKPAESSSAQSDLANHPKFAKFKKQGVNQP